MDRQGCDSSFEERDNQKGEGLSTPTDNSAITATKPTTPTSECDGGYGWVVTACTALINAHTWGVNATYGIFLAHYLETNTYPGATSLQYAFVGSLSFSLAMLVSPLATLTTRLYGTKVTLSIGVLFQTASLIGASFAKKIWQLLLSQGICYGLGMGFLFVGSAGIVSQWFTKRRSLANGIAAAGSGLGGLTYTLAAQAMIRNIGIPWTFRVLGIICFAVNTICMMLLKDRNAVFGSSQIPFEARLLRRTEYLLLCGFGWFSMLAYVLLIFSLANYANSIGLDANQAAIVSALLNLGQGIGRSPIGYFSDTVGRINMAASMTLLAGIFAFAIWIPASSYGVCIAFALLGGAVAGTFWAVIAPLAAEVTGIKGVPSALSVIWIVIALPVTFSEPIALEIVDHTGSYLGTQLFTGFMYIAAGICLLLLRGWKIGELEELDRLKHEGQSCAESSMLDSREDEGSKARAAGRRVILANFWKLRHV